MSAGYSQMALSSSEIEFLFESAVVEWVRNMVGFPGGSVVKNLPASAGDAGDTSLIPWPGRPPGGGRQLSLVFLQGRSHGQRSLTGYSPWVPKQSDTTGQLSTKS